jgi:hypothetical protein
MSTTNKILLGIAAPFIALALIALLAPAAYYAGKVVTHYFPNWSWDSWSLPQGIHHQGVRPPNPFVGHPASPTKGAQLTSWGKVYGESPTAVYLDKRRGVCEDPVGSRSAHLL